MGVVRLSLYVFRGEVLYKMIEKYEIFNLKFSELEGYLFYDTDKDMYSMTLLDNYDGKHPDIWFKIMHDMGVVDVPQHIVDRWVQGRVFPPSRQGLKGMLQEIGIPKYDLHALLIYFEGRCQMDYSCIRRIS